MDPNDQALELMTTTFSKWRNPTTEKIAFNVLKEGRLRRVEVNPGETVHLEKDLDQAIKKIKGGVVVSGLAPMLVREGEEEVPLHFALADSIDLGDLERLERGQSKIGGRDAAALVRAQKARAEKAKSGTNGAIETARAEAAKAEADAAELKALLDRAAKARAEKDALQAKLDEAGLGTPADAKPTGRKGG